MENQKISKQVKKIRINVILNSKKQKVIIFENAFIDIHNDKVFIDAVINENQKFIYG
jgi:hypothetical protein